MTSQGQRFRRRALRRGYKVDEVDLFLDRVEATLNGDRVDQPVRSQEVHDVVFRVRFGGYDEWQVDLHLDRVERQLADQEPSDFGNDRISPDRMPAPDGLSPRMPGGGPGFAGAGVGPGMGQGSMGPPNMGPGNMGPGNMGPGNMDPRGMGPGNADPRAMGPGGMGAGGVAAAFERDRPSMGMSPRDLPPRDQSRDMPRDPRDFPSRDPRDDRMMPPPNRPMGPGTQPQAWPDAPPGRPPQGGFPGPERPGPPPAERPGFGQGPGPGAGQTYGGSDEPTFAGFEPGRRARPDMTSEMRMPDRNQPGPSAGMPPAPAGPSQGQGMGPSMGPGQGQNAGMVPSGEVQRIDQLRRTFQLRRFGSGYDRAEVDRLFEGVVNAMSGRSTMPLDESELDPHQFNLVPGGYFESEVDQALREVRDIIRRR